MECSRKNLIIAFCFVVLITTLLVFTSVNELPGNVLHRVFQSRLSNISFFGGVGSYYDSWHYRPPLVVNNTLALRNSSVKIPPWETDLKVEAASDLHSTRKPTFDQWTQVKHHKKLISSALRDRSKVLKFGRQRKKYVLKTPSTTPNRFTPSSLSVNNLILPTLKQNRRLPDAIIIGVKKGGTRALLQFLNVHPLINAARHEIHFFDKNYNKGLEWYKEQMPLAFPQEIVLEKTPAYFVTPDAPERVYKMNPHVKLIVSFRDPTRRSISDYAQGLSKARDRGRTTIKPFDQNLFLDKMKTQINTEKARVRIGMYSIHLKRWLKVFPRDQFVFINGENFAKRPWEELKLIQNFLKIPVNITQVNFFLNETKGFYCLKQKKDKHGKLKDAGCLRESKGRKHPHIPEDIINKLQKFYKPYNTELYKMTQRDFGWT